MPIVLAVTLTYEECFQHIAQQQKKCPTSACYLPADLIAAIYLFLCIFGLGLDWLSVGGGGALVVTLSFELGCAQPTVGLFA